ncbi:MAG TPA: sigma-70 factor domain-containing protein, partial [Geomonas sp.]
MNYTMPAPVDSLTLYLTEINRFPLLSADEERHLALRFRDEGDLEAAHRLITANLRFVVKVAGEYRSYGMKMLDLIQEGNIGLMMAVRKF